jgi:hypothetical protein
MWMERWSCWTPCLRDILVGATMCVTGDDLGDLGADQEGGEPMAARRKRRPVPAADPDSPQFTRRIEDFSCEHCGQTVRGNGYTNHCPYCLHSKHVDINPGDRASNCGGLMMPIVAGIERDQYFLVQLCQKCGHGHKNKAGPRDDRAVILRYFGRPIPPTSRR